VLALVASVLVIVYLAIPGVLFRAVFSLFVPLRAFDRTRTQEFAYSVVVCAVPYVLALVFVWQTGLGRRPFAFSDTWEQRGRDYKTVLTASFAEPFADSKDAFWDAAVRSGKRQGRVLAWYVSFVVVEAILLGYAASQWGKWQPALSRSASMPARDDELRRGDIGGTWPATNLLPAPVRIGRSAAFCFGAWIADPAVWRRSPGIVRFGRQVYQEAGWRPL